MRPSVCFDMGIIKYVRRHETVVNITNRKGRSLESHFHEGLYYRNEKVRAEKVGNNNKKEQGTFCFEKGQFSYRLPNRRNIWGARRQKWTQILKVFKNCGFLEKRKTKNSDRDKSIFLVFSGNNLLCTLWNM